MANNGNLPPFTNQSSTTEFFDSFYLNPRSPSQASNDVVVSYFQKLTGDAETGKALAAGVMYTALQQGLDPVGLIEQLKRISDKNKITSPTYSNKTNENAQDTSIYSDGVWTSGNVQYAKPGPSMVYNSISEVDAYLTLILNLNRSGTSLLGLNNSPETNPYIRRTILA